MKLNYAFLNLSIPDLNSEDKVASIDQVLKEAEKRNLTLFRKVCIIKSVVILPLMYVVMCLTIPEKFI